MHFCLQIWLHYAFLETLHLFLFCQSPGSALSLHETSKCSCIYALAGLHIASSHHVLCFVLKSYTISLQYSYEVRDKLTSGIAKCFVRCDWIIPFLSSSERRPLMFSSSWVDYQYSHPGIDWLAIRHLIVADLMEIPFDPKLKWFWYIVLPMCMLNSTIHDVSLFKY